MKRLLMAAMLVLASQAMTLVADEVPWPSDFWQQVTNLLQRQARECVSTVPSVEMLADSELTVRNWALSAEDITVYREPRRGACIIIR